MLSISCDFYSDALGMATSMRVLLPQPAAAHLLAGRASGGQGYPVLYLLHGLLDDHTTWHRRTAIERYADPLGLAVVMPAAHRSFYTDMAQGYRYWTFVTEELPALVRASFPISLAPEDTFVAGLSMGGYGAFKMALTHPERYAAAASLSGALDMASLALARDAAWEAEMGRIFGDAGAIRGSEHDLLHLAEALAGSPSRSPRLYQCCGTEDHLYEANLRFRAHAGALGLPLTYEEGPGGHEWAYWDQQIERVLAWLPLRRAGSEPPG